MITWSPTKLKDSYIDFSFEDSSITFFSNGDVHLKGTTKKAAFGLVKFILENEKVDLIVLNERVNIKHNNNTYNIDYHNYRYVHYDKDGVPTWYTIESEPSFWKNFKKDFETIILLKSFG